MLRKIILTALLLTGISQAYTFTLVDTRGDSIAIGDLLAQGKHIYLQWTAQY